MPRSTQEPLRQLRRLRIALGLSVRDLAHRVGCVSRSVERYEAGKPPRNRAIVERLAAALGVKPEILSSPAIDLWVRPAGLVVVDRSEGRRS